MKSDSGLKGHLIGRGRQSKTEDITSDASRGGGYYHLSKMWQTPSTYVFMYAYMICILVDYSYTLPQRQPNLSL